MVLHEGKLQRCKRVKENISNFTNYLNALTGNGAFSYGQWLFGWRDSTWKAPLFEFHGMTVDCIDNHQPSSEEEKQLTMQISLTERIMNLVLIIYLEITWPIHQMICSKKTQLCIVDEVDSVLIDDARTPLIYFVQYHKEIVMNLMSWNQNWKLSCSSTSDSKWILSEAKKKLKKEN
jgi:preprotein translocase subunit SecA